MKKVLIVDDSPQLLKPIKAWLDHVETDIKILTASNGEEAIEVLKKHSISTLVTDLYMPKLDGLELLNYMSKEFPKTPCIVMTGFDCPEIHDLLDERIIFSYLEKPFEFEELSRCINEALFHYEEAAAIDGLSTAGFLQLIEMEKKSCILEASLKQKGKGRFIFVEGEIYDAQFGDLNAEKAAMTMIGWDTATLRLKSLPEGDIERRISFDLKSLIFESVRCKDENILEDSGVKEKVGSSFQSVDLLWQAMRKAESCEAKQAQQILATLLKQNSKNANGWLWYSRVAENMKSVKAATENARILAPNDPEVLQGILQVQHALESGCSETSDIDHCPFCWAPIAKGSDDCSYCHGRLSIRKDIFEESAEPVKERIMNKAFHRYAKITLLDRKNVKAHYYLALVCLNLGQYDVALEQLYTTRKRDPNNDAYNRQLKILLDHMASVESASSGDEEERYYSNGEVDDGLEKKKILVVEDSATTRKVINLMLTQEGFEVVEAKNGIDGLAKFNEMTPDLVLLDIIMPGMDGYQVLSTLKKNETLKNIPVIMLTAKDSLLDKIKGKMSGSDAYLTKPFNAEELMEKINKYLPRTDEDLMKVIKEHTSGSEN